MEETVRLKVNENAAARGAELFAGLQELATQHNLIGDVRGGHGLMCALELVSDRATKAPIDKKTIGTIQEVAYQNGAMVRVSGPNVIMSPPLVLTSDDVQTILSALKAGFSAA
jgi:4-aminobutyrate aminotransferase-like enzyme